MNKKLSSDMLSDKLDIPAILNYLIESINESISSKITVTSFDVPGEYEWEVPSDVHQVLVTASAGGASGEGLNEQLEVVSEDGEDTSIANIVLDGGIAGMVSPKDDLANAIYLGGNGEDSPFHKGGQNSEGEAMWTLDGEKGSGGMGVTHESGSGFGGGAGKSVINQVIDVQPGSKLKIKVGKGGLSDMKSDALLFPAGKGGDGFVELRYIVTKVDLQFEA